MTVYLYCPEHPEASKHGHVERAKAYAFWSAIAQESVPIAQETDWIAQKRPNVISDTMPETRHMADGKYYTSKSEYRKATRAAGCVEVGNDVAPLMQRKPVELDRKQRKEDIGRAIQMVKEGYRP